MEPTVADGTAGLPQLVLAGDVDGAIACCLTAESVPVPKIRSATLTMCREIIRSGWWSDEATYTRLQHEAAEVAITSLATIAELRKMRPLPVPAEMAALDLLAARDRAFRDDWVALVFDRVNVEMNADGARVARRLIVAGLAAKPTSDSYVTTLMAEPGAFDLHDEAAAATTWYVAPLTVLRRNPDLCHEDVWRLFEVEGGGQNSLAAREAHTSPDLTWQTALVALSDDKTLDRQRLLDCSLDSLQRGFAQFRAHWYAAFHDALNPTLEERAARASRYLALTASPVGPTVSMALKALALIERADALDPRDTVDRIGPALLTPAKGSALKALTLLAASVRRDPGLVHLATRRLVPALGHQSAEVQMAAVAQLQAWNPTAPPELLSELRHLQAGCHVSAHNELAEWLGETTTVLSERPATQQPYRRMAPTDITEVDWLAPERALRPFADLDEFFETASAVLEEPGSADDLERVLTFLAESDRARLATSSHASALRRRAAKLAASFSRGTQGHIASALSAGLSGSVPVTPIDLARTRGWHEHSLDRLLIDRMTALAATLATDVTFTPPRCADSPRRSDRSADLFAAPVGSACRSGPSRAARSDASARPDRFSSR